MKDPWFSEAVRNIGLFDGQVAAFESAGLFMHEREAVLLRCVISGSRVMCVCVV